ncbi:MAG: ribosome maturation factor RimP [Deltaproteobacteria bacterium]|nr:ribosome maturation factor RimP [Deltaproteobacteria bacterium]
MLWTVAGAATARRRQLRPLGRREVGESSASFCLGSWKHTVMYRDIPEELRTLVEPAIEEAGYELVDLLLTRGRGSSQLRITIDTPAGDGLVPVDRLADVSRELGTLLDAADAIAASYRLDVSSPGLDRVLARAQDFEAACGSKIKLETRRPLDGRRRFRGELVAFDGHALELTVDGLSVSVAFDDVSKANVMYEFTAADFSAANSRDNEARGKVARCSA